MILSQHPQNTVNIHLHYLQYGWATTFSWKKSISIIKKWLKHIHLEDIRGYVHTRNCQFYSSIAASTYLRDCHYFFKRKQLIICVWSHSKISDIAISNDWSKDHQSCDFFAKKNTINVQYVGNCWHVSNITLQVDAPINTWKPVNQNECILSKNIGFCG